MKPPAWEWDGSEHVAERCPMCWHYFTEAAERGKRKADAMAAQRRRDEEKKKW